VAEPKNGPSKSDETTNNVGKNVDIVDGVEPKEDLESNNDPQIERKKAVAIKDSSQSGTMPRVVASGQGTFAEQILQIAWANDIKVREDADLVEVLSAIDVDSEIPIEAFAAVAEILAYVYRANAGQIPIDELDNPKETEL
jgi:flagellar biosynthesis protein